MVEELDFNVQRDPSAGSIALDQLEISHFFRQLVNLHTLHANQALVCRDGSRLLLLANSPEGGALPRLRHLRIFNLRGFEPLFLCLRWPTLRSITVTGYEHFHSSFPRRGHGQLTQLATLSISGRDSSSIAGFCHLCPFLTHLVLSSEASNYYALLVLLPPTLLQLELYGCGFRVGEYCDRALSRFTSLQHLTLDDRLFSVDLPTHLLSLVSLETLHLGRGQISTEGMIQLLRPPTLLPSLDTLTLNLVTGRMGGRLQVNRDGSMENTSEELWEAPSFSQVGGAFSAEGVSEMLVVAEEAGVKVGGTILPALEVHKAHQLELANRAIYQCFEKQSLWAYRELIVDPSCNSRLPNLNLSPSQETQTRQNRPASRELVRFELEESRRSRGLERVGRDGQRKMKQIKAGSEGNLSLYV